MATADEIRASLTTHLEALGATSQQVAVTLTELDCAGYVTATASCPVAVYLKRSGFRSPSASQRNVLVDTDETAMDLIDVPTPAPVASFIGEFDAGAYPGLIINRRKES